MATQTPGQLPLNNGLVDKTPWTRRRYAPYSKSNQRMRVLKTTPLPCVEQRESQKNETNVRSHSHQRTSLCGPEEGKTESLSAGIVNKSWRVYCVSPLYCFQVATQAFRSYEKRLNSWLAVEMCRATETESNLKKKSTFRKVHGESNDYGIEIKITTSNGKENEGKEQLVAFLYSGSCSAHENMRITNEYFTLLPICIIKGPVRLKDVFIQWFENQFGCRVSPQMFSPTDLAWLVSLFAGIGEPSHHVEMTYLVPEVIPELDTIYFKIDAKDAKNIWDAIHNSKQAYFVNDEAVRFLRSLELHFFHHFKIHLDQMQLTTVGTSVAYIGQEGRLKILQENFVCYILQQLTQLLSRR